MAIDIHAHFSFTPVYKHDSPFANANRHGTKHYNHKLLAIEPICRTLIGVIPKQYDYGVYTELNSLFSITLYNNGKLRYFYNDRIGTLDFSNSNISLHRILSMIKRI